MMTEAGMEMIDLGPDIVKPIVERIVETLEEIPEEQMPDNYEEFYEDPRELDKAEHIEELSNAYIWKELDQELSKQLEENDRAAISGIRTPHIWERLREEYDTETIEIERNLTTNRRRSHNTITDEGSGEKQQREQDMGLWYTTNDADYTVENSNGYESLAGELVKIIGEEENRELKRRMTARVS